jgi:hypothetical protein
MKNILSQKFTIAQMLQFGVVFHAIVLLVTFVIVGETRLFNAETALLSVVLDIVLYLSLKWSDTRSYPHIIILVLCIGVFFLIRIYSFLTMPGLRPLFPGEFSSGDVNKTLSYIILGTYVMVLGFWAASRSWSKVFKVRSFEGDERFVFPMRSLVFVWLICVGIELYIMLYKGASSMDLKYLTVHPISGAWLIHLFSSDTIAVITCAMALSNNSYLRQHRFGLILLLTFYLLVMLVLGSRGGPMRVGWIIICFMVAYSGNFRLSIKRAVVFSTCIILLSILMYPAGTALRYFHVTKSVEQAIYAAKSEHSSYAAKSERSSDVQLNPNVPD